MNLNVRGPAVPGEGTKPVKVGEGTASQPLLRILTDPDSFPGRTRGFGWMGAVLGAVQGTIYARSSCTCLEMVGSSQARQMIRKEQQNIKDQSHGLEITFTRSPDPALDS